MPEPSPELLVWRALLGELVAGRPAVLAVVVAHTGSSAGRCGFVMAVGRDGWLAGTIGGGRPESDAVARAVTMLREGAAKPLRITQTHRRDAAQPSGSACGGEQVVALVPLDERAAAALAAMDAALTRGETAAWAVGAQGWAGGGEWRFEAVAGPSHRVVVVGAGHVGGALVRALVPLGFRVAVVDERPGAVARLRGAAHEVLTLPYEQLAAVVAPGGVRTLVVVGTHAPDRDAAAVAALAGIPLGYLGVLGNPAKLGAAGASRPALEIPAGVAIGSHTPEEIATSLAARLIAARARGHRDANPARPGAAGVHPR